MTRKRSEGAKVCHHRKSDGRSHRRADAHADRSPGAIPHVLRIRQGYRPLDPWQQRRDDNYDSTGKVTGRSSTSGDQTTIYGSDGRRVGTVTTTKQGR